MYVSCMCECECECTRHSKVFETMKISVKLIGRNPTSAPIPIPSLVCQFKHALYKLHSNSNNNNILISCLKIVFYIVQTNMFYIYSTEQQKYMVFEVMSGW